MVAIKDYPLTAVQYTRSLPSNLSLRYCSFYNAGAAQTSQIPTVLNFGGGAILLRGGAKDASQEPNLSKDMLKC